MPDPTHAVWIANNDAHHMACGLIKQRGSTLPLGVINSDDWPEKVTCEGCIEMLKAAMPMFVSCVRSP